MEDGDSIRFILNKLSFVLKADVSYWWLDIIVLIILILINGFFSATEFSIVSLNNNKIRKLAEEGDKAANKLLKLIKNPSSFLATIQVGVTFAGFFSAALASDKFAERLAVIFDPSGQVHWLRTASMVIITVVLSYFSLVLGELVPKRLAMHNPEGIAIGVGGVLSFFNIILLPFTKLLSISTNLILRLMGLDPNYSETAVTEDEIRLMVDASNETGNIENTEKELIDNVFEFNDTEVSEIMTHRTNVEALPLDADIEQTLKVCCDERFSRIPVYDENIDDIVGILHVKDMLSFMAKHKKQDFALKDLIRQPFVTPEKKSIDALFREMQKNHVQMAIVIDEYGGTAGIITIEDILEELVGNIQDEYDEEDAEIVANADGSYTVDGLAAPDDVSEQIPWFKLDNSEDDCDTMGGYVINLLDRIPDEDEHPSVREGDVNFYVKEMDEKRISKLVLTHLGEAEEQPEKLPEKSDVSPEEKLKTMEIAEYQQKLESVDVAKERNDSGKSARANESENAAANVSDKAENLGKPDNLEKADKADKTGKVEKADKAEKTGKPEKADKAEKADKPEKADKAEKADKVEKADKLEKAGKPEKAGKADKTGKPEKADRADKTGKAEKADKAENSDKADNFQK